MTKEDFEKLKETVAYFGHWYDVIGEEKVSILEKSIKYIADLEKENAELKAVERMALYSKMSDQLTKAIDIIKDQNELLDRVLDGAETLSDFAQNILHKTEQFLREVNQDLNESCPDTFCEDCMKEDCTVRKLGLISTKEIKENE